MYLQLLEMEHVTERKKNDVIINVFVARDNRTESRNVSDILERKMSPELMIIHCVDIYQIQLLMVYIVF